MVSHRPPSSFCHSSTTSCAGWRRRRWPRRSQARPQATALVHEAYMRLVASGRRRGPEPQNWDSRGHFFAAAAEAMRRILVEQARRKRRHKHGGALVRMDIGLANITSPLPKEDLLALDEAMTRLAAEDPIRAQLVQLRFFVGLSNEEAAKV